MTKLQPPYRNESNQRYTKQLFHEQWVQLPIADRLIEPVFTLHNDKEGLVNLGREYIKDADPTGYTTSTRVFKDFGYWKHLLKASWFRDAVKLWNEELEAKLYAEGLMKIRAIAKDDQNKGQLTAAKYLADHFKQNKNNVKRGRPSTDEVDGELKRQANEEKELRDAADRIQLVK